MAIDDGLGLDDDVGGSITLLRCSCFEFKSESEGRKEGKKESVRSGLVDRGCAKVNRYIKELRFTIMMMKKTRV